MAADPPTRSFEEQLRALSQALPASVFITDAEGLVRYVNPYWSAFTGLSSEETLGSAWIGVLHPDDKTPTLQTWAEAARAERSFHEIGRASGRERV